MREAQQSRSPTQDLANRADLWLTIIAIASSGLTLAIWPAALQSDFAFALEHTDVGIAIGIGT